VAPACRPDPPEANHAHDNRRGQFETAVVLDPIREKFGQTQMIADTRGEPFASKRAPYHPRFESAKTAAKLHPEIHVVDLGADGIAQVHVLRRERKEKP